MDTTDFRRQRLMLRALDGHPVDLERLDATLHTPEGKVELAALVLDRARRSAIPPAAWRRVRLAFAIMLLLLAVGAGFIGGRLSDTSLSMAFVPSAPPPPSRTSPPARLPFSPPHRTPLGTPGAMLISYR